MEAREHLHAISGGLFALEKSSVISEQRATVESIFRRTHTLKGAARMVGEEEAESLCQILEQQLGDLKNQATPVAAEVVAELHERLKRLRETLALGDEARAATPPEPLKPAAPAVPDAPPRAPGGGRGLVRVPSARLDALLVHAEELLTAKLTGAQRVAALRAVAERGATWKKEWARIRKEMIEARRFLDDLTPSPVSRELKALVHFLDWNHEFVERFQNDLQQSVKAAGQDQRRLGTMVDALLEETKEVLMLPFTSLLEVFPAFVRETALQQGKEIDLVIVGGETEIDRRVLEEMKDVVMHLVRNSIDHGIDLPEERVAAHKPGRATLTIAVAQKGGNDVEISVSDDGRGIDPAKVTASARRLGLLPDEAVELGESEALSLLFESGFSTKSVATELSGRGLGLAIVREKAEQIGGSVVVESEVARGAAFRLLLPITLARFRGVFVAAQEQPFVIPAAQVRKVIRITEAMIKRVKNQEMFEVDRAPVALVRLSDILGLAPPAKAPAATAPVFVVLLSSGRSSVGLRVEGVPYEQEIVMKGLGRLLAGVRHFVGATIVGSGQIVPVLNASNLVLSALRRGHLPRTAASRSASGAARKKKILIAEDSITSRSLLKSILQAAGFEVKTSVDGAEAFNTLKFEPIDLLISDVQMPRLDGFELTAKVRADPSLSTLPVILITSLASSEDKTRGVQAGANAYLVKSSFDQSDLLESIGRLIP